MESKPEKEKRLRDISLEDYGLDDDRCRELKAFCRQYQEKRRRALGLEVMVSIHSPSLDGVHGSGGVGRPTETAALRAYGKSERARRDCRMIEAAAHYAAEAAGVPSCWRALLASVAEGVGYEIILARYAIPLGRTDFYAARRALFYKLDALQYGDTPGRSHAYKTTPPGNGAGLDNAEK